MAAMRALFAAHNLEDIYIQSAATFDDMTDSFLEEIATALPRLKRARLHGWDSDPKGTMRGMANFAKAMPSLTILGMSFVGGNLTRDEDADKQAFKTGKVEELHVGQSLIADRQEERAIASFLMVHFPNLRVLSTDDYFNEAMLVEELAEAMWYRVNDDLDLV
jgi:hypothetical protein